MTVSGPVRPARAAGRTAACAAVTALLTGCSVLGDVRREPAPPTPRPAAEGATPGSTSNAWVVERRPGSVDVRRGGVRVPADFAQQTVEFADAARGAALFTRCRPAGCAARLLVTADGGRTWQERDHPLPQADNQQLHVGAGGAVLLLAEPVAWFLSGDAGRTFRRIPYDPAGPPVEYRRLLGEYQVCCDGDERPRIVRYPGGGGAQPVPAAPPLPGRVGAVAARPGAAELWAAALDAGSPGAAVSRDQGRTWTGTALPGAAGGLVRLRLLVSANGADVWLLGEREDRTRFPTVWRWEGAGWRQLLANGHPDGYLSAVAIGDGLLAVTGPGGGGLAGERWTPTDWPANGWIRLLPDGTLEVADSRDGSVWLGAGDGVDRRWAQLVLR
ncbi:hypothetical protein [Spirilliplanes yamanashiensis]|uniref:Uncharacterized protein n=1 Tax=Spirilliplanes yamanashiensis TaxID=42233 RepID=A0A8J3Y727_9ACTN|nr:hypothetical protein [Spirilliplanes yamanashiensis]MDP9815079.1 hypothetical protein [Spirilliplanes yamanashiensis]GIJ02735.1 hypothetical protein Sya03_20870 [Spirilliplanes yamanashiensis]